MKDYEAIFIIKPNLTEDANKKLLSQIESEITKNGGSIANIENMGKRNLAYIVKKNKEGYYSRIEFKAEPAKIEDLRKTYRLNEDIIKLSIITK